MDVGAPEPPPGTCEVLTVGETLVAVRTGGPLRVGAPATLTVAGAESNVAIGLSRLGHSVRWLGLVGDDEAGELVRRTLLAEAVDVSAARVDPRGPTGLLLAEARIAGWTRVRYYRTGSAGSHLAAADVAAAMTPAPRVLHVTGITAALGPGPRSAVAEAVGAARRAGTTVCLDVNYRSRLWPPREAAAVLAALARRADIVVASDDELVLVAGPGPEEAQVGALLDAGATEVVVTRGAAGASVHTPDGKVSGPARPVPVVDVMGAGDAFVAGYLSAWLEDLDVTERLHRATAVAAFVVASPGDWEGLPSRAELPQLDGSRSTILR
jgi:2-dehydro-3-deoxygluconokinase